ncbi:16S rRNA (guanine(527)-N(7))-methyltransferase RsmG [bacterium]|nr:16S rRNA (guanine(527)-N(7))-methyltransferase RsmG [bacterium]
MTAQEVHAGLSAVLAGEAGLPTDWAERLAAYLCLVEERNRQVNLVSRAAMDRLVEGQLLPSLAVLLAVPPGKPLRVIDIGSGGGFPAIPLRILRPEIRLDLVEATRKKCDFLREVAVDLDLEEVVVHWCRVEDPTEALLGRGPFDVLTARAVGAPDRVEAGARRFLGPRGSGWRFVAPGESPKDLVWPPQGRGAPVTALRRLG